MATLRHTKIYTKPIAKNGTEYFGVKAYTNVETAPGRFMEIEQYGDTAEIATTKLLRFLESDGEYQLEEITT